MTDGTPLHHEEPEPATAHAGGGARLPDLGPRGEGWVALQVVLLGAIAASGWRGPAWPRAGRALRLAVAGPAALAGATLFFAGGGKLGRQLTPFPRPVDGADLRRDGAYGVVRHPIYGGLLLLTLAWALVGSPAALPPWAATVAFFDAKRRREEAWLGEQHADYEQYRAQVPHALLPYVW
jgi:protein-S-isoprenylcysteine O-methyltransferase Ste14